MKRDWLKQIRLDKKLKQSDVYEAVGISSALYSRIESGAKGPSMETAARLSDFMDFPMDLWKEDALKRAEEKNNK